ncbi:MAG: hypothetical protein ACJ741_21305 [Pyrinomonadaceae bacterium]
MAETKAEIAETKRSWAWAVAGAPAALMAAVGLGLYFDPGWSNRMPFLPCAVLGVVSVLTGIAVPIYVLVGWRRRRFRFWSAGVVAALLFAAVDVLVPVGLIALLILMARAMNSLMT